MKNKVITSSLFIHSSYYNLDSDILSINILVAFNKNKDFKKQVIL